MCKLVENVGSTVTLTIEHLASVHVWRGKWLFPKHVGCLDKTNMNVNWRVTWSLPTEGITEDLGVTFWANLQKGRKQMKETIYECFVRKICSNCKNRTKDQCHIVRKIDGTLSCIYYEKEKEVEGYKEPVRRKEV